MKKVIKGFLPRSLFRSLSQLYAILTVRRRPALMSLSGSSALQCCIAYNKHGGYCVPTSGLHRPAPRKIMAGRVYETETIDFLCAFKGEIVHAGTYFGDFLPALSRAFDRVWAFEPNPESFRCAKLTMELNGLKNVLITQAGLGAKQDTAVLRTEDEHGNAIGGASFIDPKGKLNISITSIDTSIPADTKISVIQLDVEGYEREALRGAQKTIMRCRPVVLLETVPADWQSLLNGYKFDRRIDANSIFVPQK